MPILEYIKIELNCQGFEVKQLSFSPEKDRSVAMLESVRKTSDMKCPVCGEAVHIYDKFDITLKDMPIYPDVPLSVFCYGHRYRCVKCGKTFTEDIPFAYQGTRITNRTAPQSFLLPAFLFVIFIRAINSYVKRILLQTPSTIQNCYFIV